jgi:hypothetical protein
MFSYPEMLETRLAALFFRSTFCDAPATASTVNRRLDRQQLFRLQDSFCFLVPLDLLRRARGD